jgi:amylosucrase
MYEQVSHSLLNDILDEIHPQMDGANLRHFYGRLGANFYAIHTLFSQLYGDRQDFRDKMRDLVAVLAANYMSRDAELRQLDLAREHDHDWFLSPEWVGMALYTDGFADNLEGLRDRLPHLEELGVNLLHLMPMLKCPQGASDGGYAVSDFRDIDARFGTLQQLRNLASDLRARRMLLTLDVVVNHTSREHEWAKQARAGNKHYQDYYYIFPDRIMPDAFEESMPEIFPENAPGNFTWDEELQKWVMTVFHEYQWDLNYSNPDVFIEMVDIILFWANQGADIIRLDAVAFLWKKLGTTCQNEHEAHLLLQLMKDCCQVTAPGVLFIAEAIVAPVEIAKYFGEDAVIAKECEIAYNATFMALLWDATATKNTMLLNQGIRSLPAKLDRATWLNYIRCHDDIGLGFDDEDIRAVGYEPGPHRRFIVDYYTGAYMESPARGKPFGRNDKTDDARICGSLASLAGLESALEHEEPDEIDAAIERILLLHAMIMSFGGIPLIYYGDEIGALNDVSYLEDVSKANDSRWIHRPRIDWQIARLRHMAGSVQQRLFDGLQKMIGVRKATPAFADFNNRELLNVSNPHLFVFSRTLPAQNQQSVVVIANFSDEPQSLDLAELKSLESVNLDQLADLFSGKSPDRSNGDIKIPSRQFLWLGC